MQNCSARVKWSQLNIESGCKTFHRFANDTAVSWQANCKDFLLRAQTYTFILRLKCSPYCCPYCSYYPYCPYCPYHRIARIVARAEQTRLSDPALCLIPAVVDLLPKSANQPRQEIGNQAEIGTSGPEICISISKGKSHRNVHRNIQRNMHVSVRGNPMYQ